MSKVLKWFEDNIYYSITSGSATFSIQNEDLWEFEELLKKQDRKLQQKENIIKEVRKYIENNLYSDYGYECKQSKKELLAILDKEKQND